MIVFIHNATNLYIDFYWHVSLYLHKLVFVDDHIILQKERRGKEGWNGLVKNTLNVFQIMAEFCVPLHQKRNVTKQIVRIAYVEWLQSRVWQCSTYRYDYLLYFDLYTRTNVAWCQIRCSTKIQFIRVINKYYIYIVATTNVIW